MPSLYQIVAGADPRPGRVQKIKEISNNPAFLSFSSDKDFFKQPKISDICIIGTQDAHHLEPASRALDLGYDLLLEKPISTNLRGIKELLDKSNALGRKIMVCHVLRYAPFYQEIKRIVDSGIIGEIVTIDAREGVDAWHQAHSYVRGSWANTKEATPMLIAKSCHDMDILSWLANRPCEKVASFGSLSHFRESNAPKGAPNRCLEGCPVGDTCEYNSELYLGKHRSWLFVKDGGAESSDEDVQDWLMHSDYGKCVYRCNNDAVDHQVVAMSFKDGLTATFTMTAFDHGRNITLCGTKGILRGGEFTKKQFGSDIIINTHHTQKSFTINVEKKEGGYDSHMGADSGLVEAMHTEFLKPAEEMLTGIHASIESHKIGFAAEEARNTQRVISLDDFFIG